jgi:GntR family transcriptional regulator
VAAAIPLYQSLALALRRRIESGEFRPGHQLPAEAELEETYEYSRNTVRQAIALLVDWGLVETRSGRRATVAEKAEPFTVTLSLDSDSRLGGGEGDAFVAEVTAQGRAPYVEKPEVTVEEADREVAAALGVPEGTHVVRRRQQRFIDGKPSSLQTSYYPMEFVDRGAAALAHPADITGGTVRYLAETLGILQVRYVDLITVRAPTDVEAAFFRLPVTSRIAMSQTSRTAYDDTGTACRFTTTIYPADRNQFRIAVVHDLPETGSAPGAGSHAGQKPARDTDTAAGNARRHE